MEFEKSTKLANSTSAKQKQACEHDYVNETLNGSKTGDLVCTRCGNQVGKHEPRK